MSWRRPGSCGGMLKLHYAELFADDPAWSERASAFSAKVHELISFLVDVRGMKTSMQRSRDGHLSRLLLGAPRARRPQPAAAPAEVGRRTEACTS